MEKKHKRSGAEALFFSAVEIRLGPTWRLLAKLMTGGTGYGRSPTTARNRAGQKSQKQSREWKSDAIRILKQGLSSRGPALASGGEIGRLRFCWLPFQGSAMLS